MTWFNIDDGFYDHPKVVGLPMNARGLWVTIATYCARHLTDGHFNSKLVTHLGGSPGQLNKLIEAGLVDVIDDQSRPKTYTLHNYLKWNRSKNKVEKDREDARLRKQKSRDKNASTSSNRDMSQRDKGVTDSVTNTGGHTSQAESQSNPSPNQERGEKTSQARPLANLSDDELNDQDTSLCDKHKGMHPMNIGNCGGCGTHRRAVEEEKRLRKQDRALKAQRDEEAERNRRDGARSCTTCDSQGRRYGVNPHNRRILPSIKCWHTTKDALEHEHYRDQCQQGIEYDQEDAA